MAHLIAACAPDPRGPATNVSSAHWTDSIRLEETDSAFVAEPGGVYRLPDGSMIVSEAAGARVYVFGAGGVLRSSFGTRGRGPGELLSAGGVATIESTDTVVVNDSRSGRLSLFRLTDGSFLGEFRTPIPAYDFAIRGGEAWFGFPIFGGGRSHGALSFRGPDSGVVRYSGTVPSVYERYPRLRRTLGVPLLTLGARGLYVAMLGEDTVSLYSPADAETPIARFPVPRVRRRGVPLSNPVFTSAELSGEDEIQMTSALLALGALPDGRVVTVHADLSLLESGVSRAGFLSVFDPQTGEGCVDAMLDIQSEALPIVRVQSEWLIAVIGREGADGAPETWVRTLSLRELDCG